MSSIQELITLKGRRALVTGAAGVLGNVTCETLAELGANLVIVDRPGTDLIKVQDRLIGQYGIGVISRFCDLEKSDDRNELCSWINKSQDLLHILINNAAFVGDSKLQGWVAPFEDQTVETWRRAIEVNLTAVFDLCKQLVPSMRRAAGASIINIGSLYGHTGPDWRLYEGTAMGNPAAYAASKGGVIQLTRWLATSLAPGVRVNAISPGGFFRNQPAEFVARYEARTPLQRMASEDDLKGAIAYLASDLSSYVTGQNLLLDGGWSVW